LILAAFAIILPLAAQEQDEIRTRQLWDTNLQSKRPPAKNTVRPRPGPSEMALDSTGDAYVGITLWRLRPSKSEDAPGSRMLVHPPETNKEEDWTPERCEADTPLGQGQMVRLSIEAARAGYLYVIDREQYADGTLSDGEVIFPTLRTRHGKNKVTPGEVVEIPGWDDTPRYMLVRRSRPDQVAEVLTVIVAPQPIRSVKITRDAYKVSKDELAVWEKKWGAQVQKLESKGQAGKPYTQAEREAGKEGSLLTDADPLPQTMYHVKTRHGEPLLLTVPLQMAK